MMSDDDRACMRRKIGEGALRGQELARGLGYEPEVAVPEVIAALLSLAAYVACRNASMSREAFSLACEEAAREEWS